MSVDLKTLTPDGSLPTTGFVFGADSQASASPSVYTTAAVATAVGLQFPAGAQATPSISTTGDNDTGIWFPAANTVAASTGGLERMRITSTGNVGIGIVPATRLEVSDASRFRLDVSGASVVTTALNPAASAFVTNITNALDHQWQTSGTERMRITSGGFVGIGPGATNPTATLNVIGHNEFSLGFTAQTSSTQTAILSHPVALLVNTSTAAGNGTNLRFSIADTGGTTRTVAGVGAVATAKTASTVTGDMYFYTGAVERMRIDSNGRVGIGTTGNSFHRLVVVENTNNNATALFTAASDTAAPSLTQSRTRASGTSVVSGDSIGTLEFQGWDGSSGSGRALAIATVDGATSTGSVPTRLTFWTTPSGSLVAQERMRIDNQGNVGIATGAAPNNSRLHILGSGSTQGLKVESTSTTQFDGAQIYMRGAAGTVRSTGFFHVNTNVGGTTSAFNINSYGAADNYLSTISSYDYNNNTWQWFTNNFERMRIHSSGDVGIGTTATPNARLEVAGRIWSTPPAGGFAGMNMYTAAASGFAPGQISFTRASATGGATPNNSAVGEFRFDGRDANGSYTVFAQISAEMFTNAAGGAPGSMSFFISASGASAQERMRLTSQGLGVGSTSFGASAERVLSIGTGVAPTTGPADTIQIYSTDLSAGNTILSVYTEGAGATNAGITNTTVTNKIAVRINGTVYYLLATTNGT